MNNRTMSRLGAAFLPVAAIIAPVASAQAQPAKSRLTIDATARVRAEAIDGQFRPNSPEHDFFVSSRTTVAARVEIGALTLGGEIIDARGYAQDERSSVRTNEVNALEPAQAYATLRLGKLQGGTPSLTAGRFTMDIGASRLVGRTDFPNGVQSYLGGMAEWRTSAKDRIVAFWTHPFAALPEDPAGIHANAWELDRLNGNVTFFGADASFAKAFGKVAAEAYGYRLAEDDRGGRPTRDRRLVTVGGRMRLAPAKNRFDFEVEVASQRGQIRATSAISDRRDLDVRAGFAHVEAGRTLAGRWTPRLSVMFDYASGDGPGTRYGRFDTLFGARRADFGPLSLFGPVGRANLVSPGIRIEAKPSKRVDFMAAARGLWLAQATDSFASTGVRDPRGRSGTHAGTQVEARVRRWLVPDRLRLEVGGAYLAKGEFLRYAPNAPATGDTRYGFMDLSAAF